MRGQGEAGTHESLVASGLPPGSHWPHFAYRLIYFPGNTKQSFSKIFRRVVKLLVAGLATNAHGYVSGKNVLVVTTAFWLELRPVSQENLLLFC